MSFLSIVKNVIGMKNVAPESKIWEASFLIRPNDGDVGPYFERKVYGSSREEMWDKLFAAADEVTDKLNVIVKNNGKKFVHPVWHEYSIADVNGYQTGGGGQLHYVQHVVGYLVDDKRIQDKSIRAAEKAREHYSKR